MKQPQHEHEVHYDLSSDVLYLGFRRGDEESFVEVSPGVSVELDEQGQPIGIEIINASKVLKPLAQAARARAL